MGDGGIVRVVERKRARTHRIDQCRVQYIQLLAPPHDGRFRGTVELEQKRQRMPDIVLIHASGRATHPVDESTHAFMPEVSRQSIVLGRNDITGERTGNVFQCRKMQSVAEKPCDARSTPR